MQNNGVNRVFFRNEGCIFNAEKPRACQPGSSGGLRMVNGGLWPRDKLGCADSTSCINPTTNTQKGAVQTEPPLNDVASRMPLIFSLLLPT